MYEFKILSDQLIFIRWEKSPTGVEGIHLAQDMLKHLSTAEKPLCFLIDARGGAVNDVAVLRKMNEANKHPNLAGAAAFGVDPLQSTFAGLFLRLVRNDKSSINAEMARAVAFLEEKIPGVTANIDLSWVQDHKMEV